jgi:hypothetical protein
MNMIAPSPSPPADWSSLASSLHYSSSHIVGIGIRGVNPHDLKCWLYYPEDNCPFYRCTVFSHYAEANCPPADALLPTLRTAGGGGGSDKAEPGPYWSLMLEVSESKAHKPVDLDKVVQDCVAGCVNVSLMEPGAEIVSLYHRRLEHGYARRRDRNGAPPKTLIASLAGTPRRTWTGTRRSPRRSPS